MDLIVTVSLNPAPEEISMAVKLSKKFKVPFVKRRGKKSLLTLKRIYKKNILVVERGRKLVLHTLLGQKLFFHPGLLKVRLLNFLRTNRDSMIEAMDLREGDEVLDCNLGLAQDALLAAFVSKRRVVGLEKDPIIAEIVKTGLENYIPEGKLKVIRPFMKLIEVRVADNAVFLKKLPDKSFDVVYFSPMFIKPDWHCDVMSPLREVAPKDFVSPETLSEAERVARKRVVIKVNRGVQDMFPYLSSYTLRSGSTRVEYLYKCVR